jgi:CubicO group peptidase (beta-lactamase class C family)
LNLGIILVAKHDDLLSTLSKMPRYMRIRRIVRLACFALILPLVEVPAAAKDFTNAIRVPAQPIFPGDRWERETNGLSSETLREVDGFVHTLATSGLMVVKNGRVIYEFGDVKRLSYLASSRKSVLSMLYGSYVASGKIRLDATLKDLDMSEVGGLLPIEERAKVIDLITARSGIYHPVTQGIGLLYELRFSACPGVSRPSAEPEPSWAPPRGSKVPGTWWRYFNWDFNTAGAVFERMTGTNIFDALRDDFAIPIGMQDFDRTRQQQSGDQTRSQYPAYHMVLSTRDMARLGLLMLRQGTWRGRQIIPADWVRQSTSVRTPLVELNRNGSTEIDRFGYGYLWWVWDGPLATGPYQGAYTSMGSYGQFITVLPAIDMVVAHKSCPPGDVSQSDYFRLLDLLTQKQPASTAELAAWTQLRTKAHPQPKEHIAIKIDSKVYEAYVGQYIMARDPQLSGIVTLTIKCDGGALFRQVPGWFAQAIFPESETGFFNATEDEQLTFVKNRAGEVTGLIVEENGTFGESGRREFKRER